MQLHLTLEVNTNKKQMINYLVRILVLRLLDQQ